MRSLGERARWASLPEQSTGDWAQQANATHWNWFGVLPRDSSVEIDSHQSFYTMPVIQLETFVQAPVERCFDLCRSIDAHRSSLSFTREEAIAGVTRGFIGLNDEVTWQATHFGVRQKLTVRIDRFERPNYFRDSMVKGIFQRFSHEHRFQAQENGCLMIDRFDYTSPLGFIGSLADRMFLERYLERLLRVRNQAIKVLAESDEWKKYFPAQNVADFSEILS